MEEKIDLRKYPNSPGVYLMKNAAGDVIYIGKAKRIRSRLRQYFARGGDERYMIPFLVAETASIDIIVLRGEGEALLLENTLIKKHKPKYNALLKDDKTFISLHIDTSHPWPMIRLVRDRGQSKEEGYYFGPYPHAYAARETLNLIQRLFPLRQCSDDELKRRRRPCLLHSIKRCVAPCVSLCSKKEYAGFVDKAIRFLQGQSDEIVNELRKEVENASKKLEFERAASLLKTLRSVEVTLHSERSIAKPPERDVDENILLDLEETCHLARYPQKIECFDTSNIAGTGHVACVVGFFDGLRDKKRTRLFHIRQAQAGDDYGAMKEILTRRLAKAKEEDDLPDLVIVDGGRGQLHIALEVFHNLEIASVDLMALAKESARHDKGLSQDKIYLPHSQEPLFLERRSPLLFFLQKIRDEAHRTAIGFHRRSRKKILFRSALDEIPGIGPVKKKRLFSRFGSCQRILHATDEDILSVKGITQHDLDNLRTHLSQA